MTLASRSLVRAVTACVAVVMLAACGDSDKDGPTNPLPNASLVGTWTGTSDLEGGTQAIHLVFTLKADSTATVFSPEFPNGTADGTWTVSATEFTASSEESPGTMITWVAPRSSSHLVGTWRVGIRTDPSGHGWFDISKQ